MMERNGILLAAKKVLFMIIIGLVCSLSLSADYKLVLTDVDGNQTQECVKSYSFSNNLESIANQSGVSKDIYSENEVMTNKVYLGKPVYRMVTTIPTLTASYGWNKVNYTKIPQNMDTFMSAKIIGSELMGITWVQDGVWKIFYSLEADGIGYSLGANRLANFSGKKVVLEYTKTTDTASTSTTFKSYVLYIPSSSSNDEVTTKDMENLGVQLLKGYSYDASTNSCTKN